MRSIFNSDSWLIRTLSAIADLCALNLIFLFTCIPIFTIGASLTGLYTVTFRYGTKRENGIFKPYFRAFKANFKQATILWLIFLGAFALTGADAYICYQMLPGSLHYLFVLFIFLFILVLFVFSYTFPLLSQFDNTNTQTAKNAFLLSVGYLPRTLLIAFMNAFPFLLAYINILFIFQFGYIWLVLYFSATSYLIARLLKKPLAPYLPKEEDEDEPGDPDPYASRDEEDGKGLLSLFRRPKRR